MTQRCLKEDLGIDPERLFEDYPCHEIIKALLKEREHHADDSRPISSLTSKETLYRLAYGHRHRGCTWYDEEHEIVWLCAYGRHESHDPDDAFTYFVELDAAGRLLPSEADVDAAFEDEDYRFAEALLVEMPVLLERARAEPELEHPAKVAGVVDVSISVESAPPYESVTIVITTGEWDDADWDYRLAPVLASLGLGNPDALGNVDGIAGRRLRTGETGAEFLRMRM